MRTLTENACKFFRLLTARRSAYPREIQIEITNACNLKCAMCPHTLGMVPQKDFPVELLEHLLKNNPAPKRLVLTGWGEPLMHRKFFELLAIANRHWPECQVRFTTNGILLHEEHRARLREYALSGITVSVDLWPERGPVPPQWRDILHPPSPKTHRNIIAYGGDRDRSCKVPLTLQCLLTGENFEDVKQYIHFAAQHPVEAVNLVRMQSYPGYCAQRPAWEDEQRRIAELQSLGREKGVRVRSVNRQNIALRLATHFDRICLRTDDSMYITVEGTVTPCCNLRTYTIGDSSQPVREVWNSPAEQKFFADQSPVCGSCDSLFHRYRID